MGRGYGVRVGVGRSWGGGWGRRLTQIGTRSMPGSDAIHNGDLVADESGSTSRSAADGPIIPRSLQRISMFIYVTLSESRVALSEFYISNSIKDE